MSSGNSSRVVPFCQWDMQRAEAWDAWVDVYVSLECDVEAIIESDVLSVQS